MSKNDILALNAKITEAQKERAPGLDEGEFFELFAAEQALKDFEPPDDDLEDGRVGGDNDGGLDGLYFLVNRQFVADDTIIEPRSVTRADIVLIQSTREPRFQESRVEKLNLLTEDLLDLSRGDNGLRGTYHAKLRSAIARFKEKYKEFLHVDHSLTISYYYISKGDARTVNAALRRQSDRVVMKAKDLFSSATVSFLFIGAAELLELANRHPLRSYSLPLVEAPIWPRGQKAAICLVSLPEYYKFIVDDRDEIRDQLFESNVRDWQGNIKVNQEIRETLEEEAPKEDFWWLNNGITILSSDINTTGSRGLTIETPQIVNGLQTSRAIFNYMHPLADRTKETRNVVVRVIATQEAESLDYIIKATNSQTVVPEFSLHMTERIHRDIETLLRSYNLFYDRRKNYYKYQGRPIARIIRPMALAQMVMSVVLQKPDDARARPTSVLMDSHDEVFSPKHSLQLYANCALLLKKMDGFLLRSVAWSERTNLRWYLAMHYSCAVLGTPKPSAHDVSRMAIPSDEVLLEESYKMVRKYYYALGGTDQVAKGPDLVSRVKAIL